MEVIIGALNTVPQKYEKIWIDTAEIDVQMLIDRDRRLQKRAQEKGELYIRRTTAPLFDLKDPENIHDGWVMRHGARWYKVETWSKEPEKASLQVAMERELKTGALVRYWVEY
jgi:hypothetical protein